MNILYIGSSGALSLIPFRALQSSAHVISAVGVHSPISIANKIIALENETLALAAKQADIPVIDLSQAPSEIIEQCAAYAIDVILMSCYGRRLPDELVKLAAKGCYNMHPSLLPGFRGPEPIFWQMKQASDLGVSWHQVVHDFDAGDIAAQQKVRLEDAASYSQINQQLAECGAKLMLKLLSELAAGTLTQTPQDSAIASYYPYPVKQDFIIDVSYSAQQVYNFMCATRVFAFPYQCRFGNWLFYLDQAQDYDNDLMLELAEVQADRLYIPCKEGVLIATYTDKIPV